MKYKRIFAAFGAAPWAILPSKLDEMRAFLALKGKGAKVRAEEIQEIMAGRRADGVQMVGRVAVLPVMGVISQRVSLMESASGGVSTEEIGARLDALIADKQVSAIVMAFDSPGGSVLGVSELAAKIRNAAAQKKVIGLADSIAASAAYWLLSQCREINVTPGGQVGSVGVISAHVDQSKALEKEGLQVTQVTSSKFKGEGSSWAPLSEEAHAEMQSKVNHYHSMFVADIAKGRGISEARVNKDYGQGRMLTAQEAVASGMADHIATLETVLRRAGASVGGASAESELILPTADRIEKGDAVGLDEFGRAALLNRAKARARSLEISEVSA